MLSLQLGKHLKIVLAALATLALTAGSASARVVSFIELPNEAGIQMQADDGTDVTKLGSETFHLSSPSVPVGYPADATVSHIGISLSGGYYLADILESAGGPLSDQVFVHILNGLFTVIDFISDPDQFVTGVTPTVTVVETGSLQNVLNYNNDRGELVSINVLSDLELPEPTTALLLPAALVGLLGCSRRQRKKAASA